MRLAIIALGLIISPFAASEAAAQESTCVGIENDAQRLACYDAANGRAPRSAPALNPAPAPNVAPPAPAATRDGILPNFGDMFASDDDEPAAVAAATTYQIASVRSLGGRPVFVMAGGDVWSAAEAPARVPRSGEQVSIRREGVGYWVLTPSSGEPFRVRRQ